MLDDLMHSFPMFLSVSRRLVKGGNILLYIISYSSSTSKAFSKLMSFPRSTAYSSQRGLIRLYRIITLSGNVRITALLVQLRAVVSD